MKLASTIALAVGLALSSPSHALLGLGVGGYVILGALGGNKTSEKPVSPLFLEDIKGTYAENLSWAGVSFYSDLTSLNNQNHKLVFTGFYINDLSDLPYKKHDEPLIIPFSDLKRVYNASGPGGVWNVDVIVVTHSGKVIMYANGGASPASLVNDLRDDEDVCVGDFFGCFHY